MGGVIRQKSFAGGEIAPELYGRTDYDRYATALRHCQNFFVTPHGSLQNRSGTKFVKEVKDSTKKVRLIPFRFSDDQTTVLEFGNQYVRFYRNGGAVSAAGANAWNNAVTYSLSQFVTYGGITYRSIQGGNLNKQPDVEPTWWVAQDFYELTTSPYLEAHLSKLKFAQVGDTIYITHQSYAPRTLKRFSGIAWEEWTFATLNFNQDVPLGVAGLAEAPDPGGTDYWTWRVYALDANGRELVYGQLGDSTTTVGGATPLHLTWTAYGGAASYDIYRARGTNGVFGYVGTSMTNEFYDGGQAPDYTLQPPDWVDPFASEYPAVVSFFEQRAFFANTASKPNGIWGSETGRFEHLTAPAIPVASDAMNYQLASLSFEEIRSILPSRRLLLITNDAHWTMAGSGGSPLVPTDVPDVRPQAYAGSSWLDPLRVGSAYLIVTEKGTYVRELEYAQDVDGYAGTDLSILARHLFDGYTIADWAYAKDPYSIIWAVRSDGKLLSLSRIAEHELYAWAWHDTDGSFENVCVVAEGTEDAVYVVVKRTINGSTKRYIERFASRRVTDIRNAVFLDCAATMDNRNAAATTMTLDNQTGWTAGSQADLTRSAGSFVAGDVGDWIVFNPNGPAASTPVAATRARILSVLAANKVRVELLTAVPVAYQNVATTDWAFARDTVSGLSHLEAEQVYANADGGVQGPFTVSAGAITLSEPAVMAQIGLAYTQKVETLDVALARDSDADEKIVAKVSVKVAASRGLYAGEPGGTMTEVQQRDVSDNYSVIPTETELFEITIGETWNRGGRVVLEQRDPFPLTILTIGRHLELGGGS